MVCVALQEFTVTCNISGELVKHYLVIKMNRYVKISDKVLIE